MAQAYPGDPDECIALHKAINSADYQRAERLIVASQGHSALVQIPDAKGVTPLHMAVKAKSLPIVKLLLKHGAEINAQTVLTGNGSGVAGGTAFFQAVIQHRPGSAMVEYLINAGADLQATDHNGWTPLTTAVLTNELLVPLLLDKGVDVNTVDRSGLSALDYALNSANVIRIGTAELLLDNGAKFGNDNRNKPPILFRRSALLNSIALGKHGNIKILGKEPRASERVLQAALGFTIYRKDYKAMGALRDSGLWPSSTLEQAQLANSLNDTRALQHILDASP